MRKAFAVLALAVLAFVVPVFCYAHTVAPIGSAQAGRYRVKQDQIFKIVLPAHPTTGFGWSVRGLPENLALLSL